VRIPSVCFQIGRQGLRHRASIQVEWPSGSKQQIGNVAADQFLAIDEARGTTGWAAR
jgi:hypothetical protein